MKLSKQSKNIFIIIGIASIVLVIGAILSVAYISIISHSKIGVTSEDEKFMRMAYNLAQSSYENGDIPVGAVLVVNGTIISSSETTSRREHDHRNHAEMIVINDALNKLNLHDFGSMNNVTLYTTYEPCSMCEGFIVYSKVPRVVVGARKSYLKSIIPSYVDHVEYRINERGGISEDIQRDLLNKYINDLTASNALEK